MIHIKLKAQSWSIDVALGVVIFIGAFFIFYGLLNENPNTTVSKLKDEALTVIKQLISGASPPRIVDDNQLNITKINQLKNLSYDELKRRLRVEDDFCIYFEDENGNLILINNSYKGVGASKINLSGTPCSQK